MLIGNTHSCIAASRVFCLAEFYILQQLILSSSSISIVHFLLALNAIFWMVQRVSPCLLHWFLACRFIVSLLSNTFLQVRNMIYLQPANKNDQCWKENAPLHPHLQMHQLFEVTRLIGRCFPSNTHLSKSASLFRMPAATGDCNFCTPYGTKWRIKLTHPHGLLSKMFKRTIRLIKYSCSTRNAISFTKTFVTVTWRMALCCTMNKP